MVSQQSWASCHEMWRRCLASVPDVTVNFWEVSIGYIWRQFLIGLRVSYNSGTGFVWYQSLASIETWLYSSGSQPFLASGPLSSFCVAMSFDKKQYCVDYANYVVHNLWTAICTAARNMPGVGRRKANRMCKKTWNLMYFYREIPQRQQEKGVPVCDTVYLPKIRLVC